MLEGEQQDANIEVESSEPSVETSPVENTETSPEPAQKQVPFNQDPRIQDYIERQIAKRDEQYQRQMAEMQARFQEQFAPKPEKQVNPFVQKLREIDPSYAEYIESLEGRANKVDNLEKTLQRYEQQQLVAKYETAVERMHTESKTPEEIKPFIREQLDAMALSGRLQSPDQVQDVYKTVLARYTTLIDGLKRAERASYVQDKSKDTTAPTSQPKGKAPARNEKGQFTGDKEADLANIARRALKRARAEHDV